MKKTSVSARGLSLLATVAVLAQSLLLAVPAYGAPMAPSRQGTPVNTSGLQLDLSSTQATTTGSALNGLSNVNINNGGTAMTVSQTSVLTPAQLAAAQQVLQTGQQTLILGAQGNAVAGVVTIGSGTLPTLAGLIIPAGVTAFNRVNPGSNSLNISGTLQNSGLLNVVNTTNTMTSATMSAANILNLIGGVITAGPNVNLTLSATNGITNNGVITSVHDLNLVTPLLQNTGLISSTTGNINVSGVGGSLLVTGTGGTIEAQRGNINVNAGAYGTTANINLVGGNYLSQFLNVDAGKGAINGALQNVSSLVNLTGCFAAFGADTDLLNLGALNIAGDPTYYNTGGSLVLNSVAATNGADLALIAKGDVVVKGGTLDTSAIDANGGSLLIVAGADFSTSVPGNVGPPATNGVTVTINGGSLSGGGINLTGVTTIDTRGKSTINQEVNGGNVSMYAFSGTGAGNTNGLIPGSINLGSANVYTFGASTPAGGNGNGGTAGNVNIIAGATTGAGVTAKGNIFTGGAVINVPTGAIVSGPVFNGSYQYAVDPFTQAVIQPLQSTGSSVAGKVDIATATPLASSLQVLNGTVIGGSITKGAIQASSIALNDVNASSSYQTYSVTTNVTPVAPDGGDITLTAGTTVTARNLIAFGAPAPFGFAPGTAPAGNGGRGGDVFVQSGSNISLAYINTTGGGGAQSQINGANSYGGNGGDGGTVTLQSTAGNISVTSNFLTAAILSAGGAGHTGSFQAAAGKGGNGGTVSVVADLGTALIKGIEASGGGGGGGSGGFEPGGALYGDGGAGGNGAVISVVAKAINLTGYVASNGGGGGGGGGSDIDIITGGGGGGGGGGSNYQAGFPGTALFVTSSGGGGGGGFVATVGGSAGAVNGTPPGPPNGQALYQGGLGAGVLGGTGGTWGLGGSGGTSSSGFSVGLGGNGGGIGEAGTDGLDSSGAGVAGSGGAAGNGGQIQLRARSVAASGTLFDFTKQTTTNIAQKNASIMALGPNGLVNIDSTGTVAIASQVYNANADLSQGGNIRTISVAATVTGSPFVVGSATAGNGTKGQIITGLNAVINNQSTGPGIVTPGTFQNTGEVVLSNNHAFSPTNPFLTPAEQIALIQISAGLPQTLVLNAGGAATGGTFNLGFANVPAAGFSVLTIPTGVTATSQVGALKVTGTGVATINGSLLLPAFGASITAGSIVGTGNITAGTGASALTLTATAGNIGRTVGGGMPLSVTANNVVASAFSSNEISNTLTSVVTLGDMTAKNGALTFSSGGGINLTGTVTAFGGPLSVTAGANSDLVLTGLVNLGGGLNNMVLSTSGSGRILQTAGAVNTNYVLNLNSGSGEISLNNITSGLVVANSAGNVTLKAPRSIQFGSGSTVGGTLTVTAESVNASGPGSLTCGSCLFNTSEFNTNTAFSFFQSNPAGNFTVLAPAGYDLSLGGMNVNATAINFTATTGSITIGSSTLASTVGTSFLAGANSSISTADIFSTVNVGAGPLTLSAATVFNPGAFTASGGPIIVNLTGNSIGTLANSQGDIVLTSNMLINSGGRDLAILASGNVLASGVATINLAGTTTKGGNLTVMAGVNFLPATTNDPVPAAQTGSSISPSTFNILGTSATGGTVSLLNTQINTSSSAANARAGNVFLMATAGSASNGQVFTGAINTSSAQGKAGSVSIFATGGGIVNGTINTVGKLSSGTVNFVAAAPTNLAGTQIVNGNLSPSNRPNFGTPVLNSGSAIQINGAVTTNSPLAGGGNKGSVTLRSDAGVTVTGGINLAGQGSGQLTISALSGAVTVKGDINASGLGAFVSGKNFANASAGAFVDIQAPQYITINGAINTSGGTITGNGNAGTAGGLSLVTTGTASGLRTGNIFVQGSLNAAGGSSTGNLVGTYAGMGGAVDVKSGAFQITGQTFANGALGSIINTGGTGANTLGAGSLALQTSAVQQLPSNFNLLSATASEVALAGAIINIGNPVVVNGTAGNVVSGTTLTSANAGAFTFNSAPVAGLTVTGLQANSTNSASVQLGTIPGQTQVTPMTGTARTKVTPAVALALWQVTHADGNTNAQTVGLLGGATIGTAKLTQFSPQGGNSTISFTQADLPAAFSAFVLAASDSTAAGAITMNVSGGSPVINLSSAFSAPINIAGTLNLTTPGGVSLINSGALAVTTSNNTTIAAPNGLVWQTSGTPISFNGTINAPTLLLLNPGGAFGFTQNVGSNVNSMILLSTYGLQSSFTYTNNKGTFGQTFNLAPQKLPTAFGLASGQVAVSATPTAFSNLTFKLLDQNSLGQAAFLQASIPTLVANTNIGLPTGLNITTQSTQVGTVAQTTDLSLLGVNISTSTVLGVTVAGALYTSGSLINRGGSIMASATTGMSLAGGAVLDGSTGVTLSTTGATADIMIGNGASLSSLNSANGSVTITSGRNLEISKANVSGKVGVTIRTGLAGDFTDNGDSMYDSSNGMLGITARQLNLVSGMASGSSSLSAKSGINLTSSGAMTLGNATVGVNINSLGAVALRGTSFSAKNTTSTTGALTIATGTTGAISILNSSSFAATGAASLTGNGITIGGNSTLGAVGTPASLGTISLTSSGVIGLANGSISSTGTTTVSAGNSIGAGNTSILAGGSITIGSTNSSFTDAGNSTFTSSNGSLAISAKTGLLIGNIFPTTSVNAQTTLSLANTSGAMTVKGTVIAGTTLSLANSSGAMTVTANLTSGTNLTLTNTGGPMSVTGNLTAGAPINPLTDNIPVLQTLLLSKGAITITNNNGGITIGTSSNFNSYGGDITIKSLNPVNPPGVAGILIGTTVNLKANGGNLIMLTNGNLQEEFSNSGNLYYATALTTTALATTGTGGAIEMGAGQTISQLPAAQLKPSGTTVAPNLLTPLGAADLTITQNGHGALVANIATPGNIDVSTFGNLTTMNLNTTAGTGGTIVFDQKGAQLIHLDGASFVVAGFKPVAYHYSVAPLTEIEVTDDESGAVHQLAHLFVPGHKGAQILTARDNRTANSAASNGVRSAEINLTRGQLFMNPLSDTTVNGGIAKVEAKKGSLFAVAREAFGIRVAACSGPGDLTIQVGGKSIAVLPGEEIIISDHALTNEERHTADGVGRRDFRSFQVATGIHATICDVSIISMLGNHEHLQSLIHPASIVERRIANRLIKTAACVQQVTHSKGVYASRAAQPAQPARSPYSAVSHLQ